MSDKYPQQPTPELSYDEEMEQKRIDLKDALEDAPEFAFAGDSEESQAAWDREVGVEGASFGLYGEELSLAIGEDAKNLTRLIAKARQDALNRGEEFSPSSDDVRRWESMVDVSGHSGASFSVVRGLANNYGKGVREAYQKAYPEQQASRPSHRWLRRQLGKLASR